MNRVTKIRILVPLVIVLFLGAYGRHKQLSHETDVAGKLESKQMNEISGIAASGISNGIYYIHNDSGDTSRFLAI
jgi:hypothetical protein